MRDIAEIDRARLCDERGWLESAAKRSLDVFGAATALVIFSVFMLGLVLLIRATQRGPVLFKQERVGLGGRRFHCLKFRTMVPNAEEILKAHLEASPEAREEWAATQKLRDDPRITPLGRVLRSTSLDELPQLFNVLAGDMSLVGPRPVLPTELARYGEAKHAYMSVRPGITGLWQVSGRNDCSYAERVELDVSYVNDWSVGTDLAILLKTLPAVIRQRGSY